MDTARRMAAAARTAPKGKGIDNLEIVIADGPDVTRLADTLEAMARRHDHKGFARDAQNLRQSPVVVLLGTRRQALGLKVCGLCGFASCAEKNEKAPGALCVFNATDLGIAAGSAAGVAMDCRVDNRIMYTAGLAAVELGMLGPDVNIVLGIPLSISGKSPFFDRKPV